MTDPDMRRWLRRQTQTAVGHVPRATVAAGPQAVAAALRDAAERGETLVVVDAVADDDLTTIGRALDGAPLLTGGSGIARALPANFIARGEAGGQGAAAPAIRGPEAILAGSCSRATRGQIAHHRAAHPVRMLDLSTPRWTAPRPRRPRRLRAGERGQRAARLFLGRPRRDVAAAQDRYGRDAVADRLDRLFGTLARRLVGAGLRRLVVAGGETSGAVVGALDLGALVVGGEIDPGVPVLAALGPPPIGLALKSGNFGGVDFFSKALAHIAGET